MKMIVDTALAEVPVNYCPLVDDGDFKSVEASVVYNAAGLVLVWNFVTVAGVMTQTAVTPTDTAGNYDWINQGNGMYSIEIPASGGASINNDTEGYGWFTGKATGVLPWAGPKIQFSPANVVNSLVVGSDKLQVDVLELVSDTQSATDLKDFADAGYDPAVNKVEGVKLADTLTTYTGNTPQTGDVFPLASTEIADIKAKTDLIPAAPASTTNITAGTITTATNVTTVNGLAAGVITAASIASDAVTAAKIAADAITAAKLHADVTTELQSGLATPTNITAGTITTVTNLTNAPTVGDLTAAMKASVNAEADTALSDYDGPTHAELTAELATADDAVLAQVALVKAKTDNLPTDPADQSLIIAATDAILSKLLKYVQLILRKDAAIATDNATEKTAINADGGSGAGAFDQATDAQEALRDRGDAAWTTATGFSTHSAADVWAVGSRTLTAFDAGFKTGYALSAAGVQAIWDALTSALTVVGSIGKLLFDNIDAAISSRLSTAGYTAPPTAAANADAVWDETLADHLAAGSTGNALNAAGSAGDPWSTAIPGAYGAGTAGKIVGDNLNATVGSRATQTSVDDLPTNAELATALGTADDAVLAQVALVKTKTDLIPADPADASDIAALIDALPTAVEIRQEMDSNSVDLNAIIVALAALPTSAGITAAILAGIVEGTLTVKEALMLATSGNAGKTDGFVPGTIGTGHLRNIADTKNRITAAYDVNGNRTAITLDLT